MPRYQVIAATSEGRCITTRSAKSPMDAVRDDAWEYTRVSSPYDVNYVVVGRYGGDKTYDNDNESWDVTDRMICRRKILHKCCVTIPAKENA